MVKRILSSKSGTTLVEMVVTFALMGIFMVAVMTCISSTILTYSDVQALTSKQLIVDSVLNEIEAYTKTMGEQINVSEDGKRLEYADSDNNYLVRMDADGFDGKYYKNNTKEFINAPSIEEGILTVRYYEQKEGKPIEKADGKKVCRTLQQLGNDKVEVSFQISEDADNDVKYFKVTVEVEGYVQSRIVHLENKVKRKSDVKN